MQQMDTKHTHPFVQSRIQIDLQRVLGFLRLHKHACIHTCAKGSLTHKYECVHRDTPYLCIVEQPHWCKCAQFARPTSLMFHIAGKVLYICMLLQNAPEFYEIKLSRSQTYTWQQYASRHKICRHSECCKNSFAWPCTEHIVRSLWDSQMQTSIKTTHSHVEIHKGAFHKRMYMYAFCMCKNTQPCTHTKVHNHAQTCRKLVCTHTDTCKHTDTI